MTKYLLSAAAVALFATPAAAADFTGPRIEARLSYDDVTLEAGFSDGEESVTGSADDTGIALGVEAGYDAQFGGNFVAGAYIGADFSSARFAEAVEGVEAAVELDRNLYLGVRGGAVVGPALLYVKGGYSRGRIKVTFDDGADALTDSETRGGYHIGAGAELALSPKSYVKAEYVRTNYNGYSSVEDGITTTADASRDQITFGVGFRF